MKDRRRTKWEIVRRRIKRKVLVFIGHYGEAIANLIFFLAFLGLLGSIGTIEISDGVPEETVLTMAVSLGVMVIFAVWKMERES